VRRSPDAGKGIVSIAAIKTLFMGFVAQALG
jgi:hypothetical protein